MTEKLHTDYIPAQYTLLWHRDSSIGSSQCEERCEKGPDKKIRPKDRAGNNR